MQTYLDRHQAGKVLAESLISYKNNQDAIVLALPRGGVPVAFEVADFLNLPLDVFIVRKLGAPGHEELAMGAIATGGVTVFNEDIVKSLNISSGMIEQVSEAELQELKRREEVYREKKPFPDLKNKIIILIDDGIATGATMRAAIKALRQLNPSEVIVAVPVAEMNTCAAIATIADKVICPLKPPLFYAVGQWYDNFTQTTDEEVSLLLKKSKTQGYV